MTLDEGMELKDTAFAKYLARLDESEAIAYIVWCLASGPSDSLAWDVLEAEHGKNWRCDPKDLKKLVETAVQSLRKKVLE